MPVPSPTLGEARSLPNGPSSRRDRDCDGDLVALVHRARAGDSDAWTELVQRFDRMLRRVASSFRLAPADVDDVVQMTWLSLFNGIGQLREPNAISGWLATATRRHALRRIQLHTQEQLTDDVELGHGLDENEPHAALLAWERHAILAAAIVRLPERHRALMITLLMEPTLEYREIAALLSMPIGSIGPIRARALARLARDAQLRAVTDSGTAVYN